MRGWIILLAVLVLASVAYATPLNESMCTDTDSGGIYKTDAALKVKGEVKYGITSQVDTCLTAENGVSTNESKWLKEYFCRDDKRVATVYDCIKIGYTGCENGECKGGTASTSSNQSQAATPVSACGNKILEKSKGEECDPPDKICFNDKSEYGLCGKDCKCKIANAAKKPVVPSCGDGARDVGEECEKDGECPANNVCSSCKCVKQLSQAEIDAMKASAKTETEKAIDEKYKAPETHEVDLTAKNFTETPGIQATSGIAHFFKAIFSWIASIFS